MKAQTTIEEKTVDPVVLKVYTWDEIHEKPGLYCRADGFDKGVTVFFITNRPCLELDFAPGPCPQEAITLKDLAEGGIKSDPDHLMLAGEQADWSREKRFRQNLIAKTYRVIMLIGDDLSDFLPCVRAKPVAPCPAATADDRARLTLQHREYWGVGWHMLPNPMHGSWVSFISNGKPEDPK